MKHFSFAQRVRVRALVSASAASCASLASPSFAQNASEPQLKPVIITASRMEQALQTAPVGASVLLGEDIRASGVLDANEAIRRLGGVTSRSDLLGGREAALDLRGYGDSAANNLVVIVDGVRISENELASARLSAIGADRIDRIEIVRGGSSVAWGEGATGGVINIITRSGVAKGLSGSVRLGLESFGTRDASANLNVGANHARFYANLRSFNTKGYRDNSDQRNDTVMLGVEAGVLERAKDGLKLRLELFKDSQGSRLPGNLPIATAQVNPKQTNTPLDFLSSSEDRVTVAAQYRLGGWLASLDVAKRDRSGKTFNDYGAGGTQDAVSSSQSTQISPRLQYAGELGGVGISALLGTDKQTWDFTKDTSFSGFPGGAEVARQTSRATFARVDLQLPTQTRVALGWRTERVNKDFSDPLAFPAPANYQISDPLKAWEFGVNQTLATGWDVYARAATSYRVANVDENRFLVTPLKPQTARDTELGLRYARLGSSAGLRLFRQNTANEIAYDNSQFANVNLDSVQRRGVELEGKTALNQQWQLSGNAQFIRARFGAGAFAGKRVPHVVGTQLQARVSWLPTAAHRAELALTKRGDAILGNDFANACIQNSTGPSPARTTLDALYTYAPSGQAWSVTAGVDNLTNRQTFGWGFTNATCSATNVYPEAGRSFKLNARYSF